MAVIRNTASMMLKGKVGATTYYVAETRQLARQAMNNSNYGESASRTDAQQNRRVRWSNLVNFYSGNKAWMPKAYENLKPGVSIFNRFMQLNINGSDVALTRSEAQSKIWAPASYRVSQGSLQPLVGAFNSEMPGITLNAVPTMTADTTVAQFSQDVISDNPQFQQGDAIIFVSFRGVTGAPGTDTGMSPATYTYTEYVLDTEDTAKMSDKYPAIFSEGTMLQDSAGDGALAAVVIHTRKSGGKLLVSTQDIFLNMDALPSYDAWRSEAQFAKAIASYGESTTVPLTPGGTVTVIGGGGSSGGGGGSEGDGDLGD